MTRFVAFLYYDSWWDTGGIKTKTGGTAFLVFTTLWPIWNSEVHYLKPSHIWKSMDQGPWYWLTTWILFLWIDWCDWLMMMIFNARAMLASSRQWFGWDIEADFWSRIWGRSLVQIIKMNFNQLVIPRNQNNEFSEKLQTAFAPHSLSENHVAIFLENILTKPYLKV